MDASMAATRPVPDLASPAVACAPGRAPCRSGRIGAPSTGVVTTQDDLERWGEAFVAFPARLADRFARRGPR